MQEERASNRYVCSLASTVMPCGHPPHKAGSRLGPSTCSLPLLSAACAHVHIIETCMHVCVQVEERYGVPVPVEAPVPATGPLAFLSGLFGGAKKPIPTRMTRPVDFPEMDLKLLNSINDSILKVGAVRLDAEQPR